MLTEAGIELEEEDTYETGYADGMNQITVRRMQMVTVINRGAQSVIGTYGETTGSLLARMGITPGTGDTLSCSSETVEFPEIRKARFNKDFYFGFYCTQYREQAVRWASRYGKTGFINTYEYTPDPGLNYLVFEEMTEEWLDFIVSCRRGISHTYDIVEGPMADDTIYNYIQNFMDGKISRAAFWELARFKYPTHQISFHTVSALDTLQFIKSEEAYGREK